eukprot:TRINITY_DN5284_c0_g1_i3.p1 TRINITY_DN5284_c0_g1~~TRINITY_DN5284_c0_g1_i3.p1  ORF type:complete len:407 (+),score=62.28 TRINITY_DN5284_c0_g1_i3:57-1277(+)
MAASQPRVCVLRRLGLKTLPIDELERAQCPCVHAAFNEITKIDGITRLYFLEKLNLSNNKIVELPQLSNLGHLQDLDLSSNKIAKLPDSIGDLIELKLLNLGQNCLTSLPSRMSRLWRLELLLLGGNYLTSVPECISTLSNLRSFSIGAPLAGLTHRHPGISELPSWISSLILLENLDVSYQKLQSIPDCITSLKNIEKIDMRGNQLAMLPDFSLCKKLKKVCIYNNPLNAPIIGFYDIIDLSQKQIERSNQKLSNIDSKIMEYAATLKLPFISLDLSRNIITSVPDSIFLVTCIIRLNLSNNAISFLPQSIDKLSNLEYLDISHNKMTRLPDSIGNLSSLVTLNVSHNSINSFSWAPRWPRMQLFQIHQNKIQWIAFRDRHTSPTNQFHLQNREFSGVDFWDIYA